MFINLYYFPDVGPVVASLTKNYAAGITVYDEIEKQALEVADMMSEGILKQFVI